MKMSLDQIIAKERRTETERRQDNGGVHAPERRQEERRKGAPGDVTFTASLSIESIEDMLNEICKGEWTIAGKMPTLYGDSIIVSFKDSDDLANFIKAAG